MTDPNAPGGDVLAAAHSYAALGWRVIPIKPGAKHPAGIAQWQTAATTDTAQIDAWWGPGGSHEGWGVGIATGAESGIWVLDVDTGDGKAGFDSLAALEAAHGPLPVTLSTRTGSGGLHMLFRWDPTHPIRNDQSGRLGPGLDVRGDGGQILAPPTVHPNGKRYQWATAHGADPALLLDAPEWLYEALAKPQPTVETQGGTLDVEWQPAQPAAGPAPAAALDGPADAYNAATDWPSVLAGDGWTHSHDDAQGTSYWTRPGKSPRDGWSASVGWNDHDALHVFTSSVPGLTADGTYSRFGYYAATRHNGDQAAAGRKLRELGYRGSVDLSTAHRGDVADLLGGGGAPAAPLPVEAPAVDLMAEPVVDPMERLRENLHLVAWGEFWTADLGTEDWLIYPIIPRGRAVSLYAGAKQGKSTILLAAIAAACTGRDVLGTGVPQGDPPEVLYLDYEMTHDDLYERLAELGYGPDDDLSHLHYALLPTLEPLDTAAGAAKVIAAALDVGADLVVVDTFGRAVEGEENEADTVRAFYRHTGMGLKARGIAVLRTDHSGKDAEKGQRGSSAKNDDVDVVWKLARTDDGVVLTRTHSRVAWGPDTVALRRAESSAGLVAYEMADDRYPEGTREAAALLDSLDVPVDASKAKVRAVLASAGERMRNDKIVAAQRWRRAEAKRLVAGPGASGGGGGAGSAAGSNRAAGLWKNLGTTSGTSAGTSENRSPGDRDGDHVDEIDEIPGQSSGTNAGTGGDQSSWLCGDRSPSLERGPDPARVPGNEDEDDFSVL